MLLANNSSPVFHYWAGRYPEKVGWLVGPRAMKKTRLWDWVTYAMDNDAFTAWTRNEDWDEEEFFGLWMLPGWHLTSQSGWQCLMWLETVRLRQRGGTGTRIG